MSRLAVLDLHEAGEKPECDQGKAGGQHCVYSQPRAGW